MLKLLFKILLLSSLVTSLQAQKNPVNYFKSPLNIPLFLSGNYGELRATHFHSGIDLKTQAVIGKPVFASGDGYVSRINIQSGGYGKSLYITHPNGYTTVYAHLEQFNPAIQAYVKKNQYNKKKFEIELFPPADMFTFKQGDLIGYSGNTGRSGGPHLHFEIRESASQVPLNALLFNLPVADLIAPSFTTLYLYSFPYEKPVRNAGESRAEYTVRRRNDTSFYIKETIPVSSPFFGIGVEVYDYLNGSANRCGVYSLQLNIDNKPSFAFTIDKISFQDSRYVNAHMDYELKVTQKKSVHRLYLLPNNKLSIYSSYSSNKLLSVSDNDIHKAEVIAYDAYGNSSRLNFSFRQNVKEDSSVNYADSINYIRWQEGAIFRSNRINIEIPPSALYEDVYFNYSLFSADDSVTTDTFSIFISAEPIHENYRIEVPYSMKDVSLQDKVIFARIDEDNKLVYAGGEYKNGFMKLSTRNFGKFIICYDTLAPVISPVGFVNGKKYTVGQRLTFRVVDDLSGLKSYEAYIDGAWALLEYDAKSDTLFYEIDSDKLTSGLSHLIKLIMVDGKENRSEFEGQFIY